MFYRTDIASCVGEWRLPVLVSRVSCLVSRVSSVVMTTHEENGNAAPLLLCNNKNKIELFAVPPPPSPPLYSDELFG